MAGARIDRDLWIDFSGAAKRAGKTVAEALEDALRSALIRPAPQKKGRG